ncbi:anti-sigma factor family protein [Fictibacillus enclensis]|uniref:anti-sigma factor family protein n=1 Tax=Fictibacillus enclensis TaxID=1017270 RepID=UPI0024BF985C|nr:anti-sigma factor [Fictibacillus enclensis]WHY72561.1 anti-sigma factor [Fictibacillus enclensis]
MSCESEEYMDLIDKALDGEITADEQTELERHMESCESCKEHYHALKEIIYEMKEASPVVAPAHFTEIVMKKLPEVKKRSMPAQWIRRYPVLTAAAVFLILMFGSVMAGWNTENDFAVHSAASNIKVNSAAHTVTVPKGETVKGDLVVENGDIKVEGKVEGNVVVIKGEKYMASAGQITGDSQEIHEAVEWVWYKLKTFFTGQEQK